MAHQGQALVGDYVGWKVGTVKARAVVLVSNDGQQLELELQVHDTPIKEPPKPVAVAAVPPAAAAAAGQDASAVGEDGQPLSRAEQIRQRIAERREELRVEQEARAAQPNNPEQSGSSDRPSRPRSAYQEAILNLMKKNNSEDNDSDSNNGG